MSSPYGTMSSVEYGVLLQKEFENVESVSLKPILPYLMKIYQDKAGIGANGARLQYLYARRHALDMVLIDKAPLADYEEDDVVNKFGDQPKTWLSMRSTVEAEIQALEASARSGMAPHVGPIVRTNTLAGTIAGGQPNPFDPRYTGSPVRRRGCR